MRLKLAFLPILGLAGSAPLLAQPSITAVGNAASFAVGPIAPGEIVVIVGLGLGPATLVAAQPGPDGRLPTTLSDTRVLFDGIAAPLIYTSAGAVSAIVPFALDGRSSTSVVLTFAGTSSTRFVVPVASTAPGLFLTDARHAVAFNEDSQPNTASNPSQPASVVVLYGTGAGQTNPPSIDGTFPNSLPLPAFVRPLRATLGGLLSSTDYVGIAPGSPAGVFQINTRVPQAAGAGQVPVSVTAGSNTSPPGPTITVAASTSVDLSSIEMSPSTASSGTSGKLTVRLSPAAPVEGVWVALATNQPSLSIPASIFVPGGTSSASVTATLGAFTAAAAGQVTASLYHQTASVAFNALPAPTPIPLASFTAQAAPGGLNATVVLSAPAPNGGLAVAISSNAAGLALPANLTVPAGSVSGSLHIRFDAGAFPAVISLRAASGSSVLTTLVPLGVSGWSSSGVAGRFAAGATVSNGVVTLHARFSEKLDPYAVTAFSLDTDRDVNSGWPGNFPNGSDPGLLGSDAVVLYGGSCFGAQPSLYRYNQSTGLLQFAGAFPVGLSLPNGFDIPLPAWLLGSSDPNALNFRAVTGPEHPNCGFGIVTDYAPRPGAPPQTSAPSTGSIPAPSLLSPADQVAQPNPAFTLTWSAVAGAEYYLVAIDQSINGRFSSEEGKSWSLAAVRNTSYTFSFGGSSPGRWRVWPMDAYGQAGQPSEWRRFSYAAP